MSDLSVTPHPDEQKAPPPQEPVPQDIIDRALALVRRVVRGNGMRPEDVTFVSFEGGILFFEAYERFKIEPRVSEKRQPGKERGEVVGSEVDLRKMVAQTTAKITVNADLKKQTVLALEKRTEGDLGFGLDNHVIHLESFNKRFVVHEICKTCNGGGKSPCHACHGQGHTQCPKCQGRRNMICPACQGTRTVRGGNGRQPCPRCRGGDGRIPCTVCRHDGIVPCTVCRGTKQSPCKACQNKGWNSLIAHIDVYAKSRFDYDREKLPPTLPPLIDSMRGQMVTEKHAAIAFIDDIARNKELDQASQDNEFIIPYAVRMPWGAIKFMVRGREVTGTLFGLQPGIVHATPFLEDLIYPGVKLLQEAARNPAQARGRIREAARTRLVAHALLAAARLPHQRAVAQMKKHYPVGLEAHTLPKLMQDADAALKQVTKGARIAGAALGLGAALALYLLYFAGPGRDIAASYDPTRLTLAGIDALVFASGALAATIALQILAAQALEAILRPLRPRQKPGQKAPAPLRPKPGLALFWVCGGLVLLYGSSILAGAALGNPAPFWWPF